MYKLSIKPSQNDTLKMVTVFQKKEFYFFNYWDAVERVLCASQYLDNHLQHYTSKYNIAPEYNQMQPVEEMQATV